MRITKLKKQIEGRDHLSTEDRRRNMSKIRQKDTKPEILLRKILHKEGFRFRKNVNTMPGKPDIVMPKYGTVIFVHGCFWHRHDCAKGRSVPSARKDFWINKFQQNIDRDNEICEILTKAGWKVIVVWECELKKREIVIADLKNKLCKNK